MVKRLRLSPLTAATRVRIPAESPKCASARCAFFYAGILTRVTLLLARCYPVHARVPRHFRVSPSPIGARCKANPGRVTNMRICSMRIFYAGILTRVRVLLCNPHPVHAIAPRHIVSRRSLSAIAVKPNTAMSSRNSSISARCFFSRFFAAAARILSALTVRNVLTRLTKRLYNITIK